MSQYNEGPTKTFTTNTTIAKFARVSLASGSGSVIEVCGANTAAIGHTEYAVVSGDNVTVRLLNCGGTFKAIASEAITEGATIYAAATGKVTDTDGGGYTARAIALEAADADGDVIEVLTTSHN